MRGRFKIPAALHIRNKQIENKSVLCGEHMTREGSRGDRDGDKCWRPSGRWHSSSHIALLVRYYLWRGFGASWPRSLLQHVLSGVPELKRLTFAAPQMEEYDAVPQQQTQTRFSVIYPRRNLKSMRANRI